MRRWISAAFVLVGAALPSSLHAQQIGPVSLPLGWERQVVLQRLARHYDVDSAGVVRSRKGPGHEVLGSVGFDGGRLTSVTRNWSTSRGSACASVSTVVLALSQLAGDLTCRIKTASKSRSADEVKAVTVTCGAHSVSITTGTQDGKPMRPAVREVWRVRAFSVSPQPAPDTGDRAAGPGGRPLMEAVERRSPNGPIDPGPGGGTPASPAAAPVIVSRSPERSERPSKPAQTERNGKAAQSFTPREAARRRGTARRPASFFKQNFP